MRRFRNPHFAPEALERKLNPSNIGVPVMAEVSNDYLQQTNDFAQAETISVDYELANEAAFAGLEEFPPILNPGHPVPGDPEPLIPSDSTSTPPAGSGDPPISDPSVPGGPGEPA